MLLHSKSSKFNLKKGATFSTSVTSCNRDFNTNLADTVFISAKLSFISCNPFIHCLLHSTTFSIWVLSLIPNLQSHRLPLPFFLSPLYPKSSQYEHWQSSFLTQQSLSTWSPILYVPQNLEKKAHLVLFATNCLMCSQQILLMTIGLFLASLIPVSL